MKKAFLYLLLMTIPLAGFSQKKIVNLPDIQGYVTLKCDFHIHTVFSDGNVWPTVRVDEACRDGLDAIAITDHLEYNPYKEMIPLDHNAGWNLCQGYAQQKNIILVHGTEITRKMPPGHFNALFIKDASVLTKDSVWDNFEEAHRQGAFLLWNHPGWKRQEPDGIPKMYDMHRKLVEKGWLNGIEFFNDSEYYPLVFTFCKQNNLALFGSSDVHALISDNYKKPEYSNRPMTLVFAKERSHDSLKEAMFAGRTIVYFKDFLVGRKELVEPFFQECLAVGKPYYQDKDNAYFEVRNNSDITFTLTNGSSGAPATLILPANSVTTVTVGKKVALPLVYDVNNVITGEKEVLRTELK